MGRGLATWATLLAAGLGLDGDDRATHEQYADGWHRSSPKTQDVVVAFGAHPLHVVYSPFCAQAGIWAVQGPVSGALSPDFIHRSVGYFHSRNGSIHSCAATCPRLRTGCPPCVTVSELIRYRTHGRSSARRDCPVGALRCDCSAPRNICPCRKPRPARLPCRCPALRLLRPAQPRDKWAARDSRHAGPCIRFPGAPRPASTRAPAGGCRGEVKRIPCHRLEGRAGSSRFSEHRSDSSGGIDTRNPGGSCAALAGWGP